MSIKTNSVLKLDDDKRYIVCSTVIYEDDLYAYLIDVDDDQNQKFLRLDEEKNTLVAINDIKLVEKVMPLLLENSIRNIKELMGN